MITRELKISKMLDKYPQTLEVLLEASPHFKKLNNRFLRKSLAGRVNIEQAARVAGVPLKELLINLNFSIGETEAIHKLIAEDKKPVENHESETNKPEVLNNISVEKMVDLDVRGEIASGTDPIHLIKDVLNKLKDDEVFHLVNSFEPVPLYTVLGKKGYAHWTEKIGDTWNVYFYKDEKGSAIQNVSHLYDEPQEGKKEGVTELDVRNLEPPEPMVKILETLTKIGDNSILLVHHHREPLMLYDKLAERGYNAVTHKIEENYYKVVITKSKEG